MPSRRAGLTSPYRGHRFPPEVIAHAVWLYFRFHLSLRDVQDLLAERGIIVSHEAIRLWSTKFGPTYAAGLRRSRARSGDKWHLDEVLLKIRGNAAGCGGPSTSTVSCWTSWSRIGATRHQLSGSCNAYCKVVSTSHEW